MIRSLVADMEEDERTMLLDSICGEQDFLAKRPAAMSEPLYISNVLVANMGSQSIITITTPILCKSTTGNKSVITKILLDTGAGGIFMNTSFAKKHNLILYKLDTPIIPKNIDGTINQAGKVTHFTWLEPT